MRRKEHRRHQQGRKDQAWDVMPLNLLNLSQIQQQPLRPVQQVLAASGCGAFQCDRRPAL